MDLKRTLVYCAFFLLNSCASNKQIYGDRLVDNSNRHLYVNDSLDFSISYFDVIGKKNRQTDSLDLSKTTVPMAFQKHLKMTVKKPSEILFQANRASMSDEDIVAVLYAKKGDFNNFSRKIVKNLLNFVEKDSLKFEEYLTAKGYFLNSKSLRDNTSYGSDFMQSRTYNALNYTYKNEKSEYKFHEFHVPFSDKYILRLIWIADIKRTAKKTNLNWREVDEQNHHLELFSLNDSARYKFRDTIPQNLPIIARKAFTESGYLGAVATLKRYENIILKTGTTEQKNEFYQEMMIYQSFIGNNKEALANGEKTMQPKIETLADNYFEGFEMHDAAQYILQKVDNQQVIMLNEAHNCGQSRAFMRDLLRGLFEKGFRYFAVETLISGDSINERGYPLRHESGYYSDEPTFGQMLREAKNLGFQLCAYETQLACPGSDCTNFREAQQAQNLKKIMDKDPKAKILVWAGLGHIREKDDTIRQMMAFRFKKLTGIDPLTIDNTLLRETSDEATDASAWKMALKKGKFKKPIVLTAKDTAFVLPSRAGALDIQVFFPRTDYSNGYPNWMGNSETIFYPLTVEKEHFRDKLLMIFLKKEYDKEIEKAVPVLNIPLSKLGIFKLFLQPEHYVAVIRDAGNWELFYEDFEIKVNAKIDAKN